MSISNRDKLSRVEIKEVTREKPTIMIVEDKKNQLRALQTLLSRDYNIITAPDGLDALYCILEMNHSESENISVIISDQKMKYMGGIEFFEHVLLIIPETIRIILTALYDKEVMMDAINRVQIYQFILKPYDLYDLKLRVKRAVETFSLKKELIKAGNTDYLTGLFNRHYLYKNIDNLIKTKMGPGYEVYHGNRRDTSFFNNDTIFLLLDIDHFKKVNDNFEHEAGDKVLKQMATVMKRIFRESDILVRWGGEEFLIISRFTTRHQAPGLAERLREAIEAHPLDLGNENRLKITCSIGFACYPFLPNRPHEIDWKKVLCIADKALYAAKNSGRNVCVGLMGTDKTKPGNLMQRINEDINKLLEDGDLLTYSTNQRPIVWRQT